MNEKFRQARLAEAFELFDIDCDGRITPQQFFTLYRSLGATESQAELTNILIKALRFQKDKDQKCEAETGAGAPKEESELSMKELAEERLCDLYKYAPAAPAVCLMLPKETTERLDALPGVKRIDFDSFYQCVIDNPSPPFSTAAVVEAFRVWDPNNTGTIEGDRLKEILTSCGEPLAAAEVATIGAMVPSVNGQVDYTALAKALCGHPQADTC